MQKGSAFYSGQILFRLWLIAYALVMDGSQVESGGQKVTTIRAKTIVRNNPSILLLVGPSSVFPTAQPTKSAVPTGGVHSPMDRLMTQSKMPLLSVKDISALVIIPGIRRLVIM